MLFTRSTGKNDLQFDQRKSVAAVNSQRDKASNSDVRH